MVIRKTPGIVPNVPCMSLNPPLSVLPSGKCKEIKVQGGITCDLSLRNVLTRGLKGASYVTN